MEPHTKPSGTSCSRLVPSTPRTVLAQVRNAQRGDGATPVRGTDMNISVTEGFKQLRRMSWHVPFATSCLSSFVFGRVGKIGCLVSVGQDVSIRNRASAVDCSLHPVRKAMTLNP